ncbi:hypothetical protein LG299_11455 [Microbacterium lacus]|uniref:hypothetical protein n=1 Tax=Microbacterium lacus TaxID=415217 RepID=UPI00384B14E5
MAEPLRFDRNARYGAALVGTLFATYLCVSTDFSAFVQAANYAGTLGTDQPLVDLFEYLLMLGLFVVSFSIAPTTAGRRLGAVTLAAVVLLLWAAVGIERGVGNIVDPIEFWTFVTGQGFIALVVGLGGWLIVRERHPLAFIVLLFAVVPPIVSRMIVDASWTSGSYVLVLEGVVIALGIGGAWLAAFIDRWARTRSSAS